MWIGAGEGAFRLSRTAWSLYAETVDTVELRPTTFSVNVGMPPLVLDTEDRLCRFEDRAWSAVSSSLLRGTSPPQSIAPGPNRTVWIGYEQSVCRYSLERKRVELELSLLERAAFGGLYHSSSGRVWVLCEDRVLEIAAAAFVETSLLPMPNAKIDLRCMEEGPDGSLWFGLSGGVQRLVDGNLEYFGTETAVFTNRHVQDICHGPDGRVWFNVPGSGLLCYDGTSWRNYRRRDDRPHNSRDRAAIELCELWMCDWRPSRSPIHRRLR